MTSPIVWNDGTVDEVFMPYPAPDAWKLCARVTDEGAETATFRRREIAVDGHVLVVYVEGPEAEQALLAFVSRLRLYELDDLFGTYEWVAATSPEEAKRLITDRYREAGCDEMEDDDWRCHELDLERTRLRVPGLVRLFEDADVPDILPFHGVDGYV